MKILKISLFGFIFGLLPFMATADQPNYLAGKQYNACINSCVGDSQDFGVYNKCKDTCYAEYFPGNGSAPKTVSPVTPAKSSATPTQLSTIDRYIAICLDSGASSDPNDCRIKYSQEQKKYWAKCMINMNYYNPLARILLGMRHIFHPSQYDAQSKQCLEDYTRSI